MNPFLTIAIPTFNRASKLKRLLGILREEIAREGLSDQVHVMVSDNASKDETPYIVRPFLDSDFRFDYHRQSTNLGFDGNLRFLYVHAETPYIWFLADDDIPLKGAISKIMNTLHAHNPDVLLFSFIQPPGSKARQFDYAEPAHLVTDAAEAIDHVLRYSKISIYVLRKVDFDESQWHELDKNLEYGWYYISLSFSVLDASQNLLLLAISDPLATCDEDFGKIEWLPTAYLNMDKQIAHPFVDKNKTGIQKRYPKLLKSYRDGGYYSVISFLFAVKCGFLSPVNPKEYEDFIKNLDCKMMKLVKSPVSFIKFFAMKFGVAGYFKRHCKRNVNVR